MFGKAIRFSVVFLIVCGLLYPLATTGLAQVIFPHQANGSQITGADGKVIGSDLIGQAFTKPEFFQGRESANNYDASNSAGTNLAYSDDALAQRVKADVDAWQKANPGQPIPADLLTASGSGLDPHITPEGAMAQVARVSKATGIAEARLQALVNAHVEGRTLGIFGEPRVNVLQLNLDLLKLQGK